MLIIFKKGKFKKMKKIVSFLLVGTEMMLTFASSISTHYGNEIENSFFES